MRAARPRLRDRRGVVAIEFALVLPVLVVLTMGMVDILTALRAQLRLETVAVQLGQIVSQCTRITSPGDVGQFWQHGQAMMGPLGTVAGTGATAAIMVTAVRRNAAGRNEVAWQLRTGNPTHASTVAGGARAGDPAPTGTAAGIAAGFTVPDRETLLVTEVTLNRSALLLRGSVVGGALPAQLRANTLFLSRNFDAVPMQAPPAAPRAGEPALACT